MKNEDLKKVIEALENSNVFLTGGAGVGKSYTTKEVISFYKKLDKNVLALASTGIAAVHIGGQTLHSFFKLGISKILPELIESTLYPAQKKELKSIISNLDLLIIDEISMVSSGVMEMIEYRLNQFGFNGRVLVVGDFLQLPPVRKNNEEKRLMVQYAIKEEEQERYFGYAFDSLSWGNFVFKKIELTTVKRTNDIEFISYLHNIRNGACDIGVKTFIGSITSNRLDKETAYKSTILYATNKKVKEYNEARLLALDEPLFEMDAKIEVLAKSKDIDKKIDTYIENLPIERVLKIKVGAPILFTTNTEEFKNGQRGVVAKILNDKDGYKIVILTDTKKKVVLAQYPFELSHYEFEEKNDKTIQVKQNTLAKIKQFPIKLAWSLTIHKSQGMSIDNIAVFIDEIFEKSQFYVAISRATSVNGLLLLSKKDKSWLDGWIEKMISVDEKVIDFYINYHKYSVRKNLF